MGNIESQDIGDAKASLRPEVGEKRMNEPQRYRKKPVVIEAMLLDGTTSQLHNVYKWVERNTLGSFEPLAVLEKREPCPVSGVSIDPNDGRFIISTLGRLLWADIGDWIIRGVKGEFYPCKPEIFEATYDPEVGEQA